MKLIHAIYEDGVFRPLNEVELPERSEVEFEPRLVRPPSRNGSPDRIYDVLSQSFETDDPTLAARHDEHQP